MTKEEQIKEMKSLAKRPNPEEKMLVLLKKFEPEIARALPRHLSVDRMARIVTTAIRTTPKLAKCTPASFFGSVIQASQLGLEVNTPSGHAYLVPYENKRENCVECQLLVGYKGYIELAYRSKLVTKIIAREVKEGDLFNYAYGTDEYIQHVPSNDPEREGREVTHSYAIVKIKDGDAIFSVLTRAQIDERRARSMADKYGKSPWQTDYAPMAKKSAIRSIAAYIPQSSELAQAVQLDVSHESGEPQTFTNDLSAVFSDVVDVTVQPVSDKKYADGEVSPDDEPPVEGAA